MAGIKLENVIIPRIDTTKRWDIHIADGKVISRAESPSSSTSLPSLLLPPLCHPHIHLDKAFILTCNQAPSTSHPDYSDLLPTTGDFQEALANTSAAKARFTYDNLYLRGSQLLAESYGRGVTSMRVFVEVDHVVELSNLEAAIQLKKDFAHLIYVQICVFAQDPLFSTEYGDANREYVGLALEQYRMDIEVLGTTPYVEQASGGAGNATKEENQRKNIEWAVRQSAVCALHLDFHLDYNLDATQEGMLFYVLEELKKQDWKILNRDRTVVVGHGTHLTTYNSSGLEKVAAMVKDLETPIHFVGLPTSDLYMMGRPSSKTNKPHDRPRGTMQVPSMINDYGLNACLGVNNVGNAFTPYGDGDPLQLACWGSGIYHAGTVADAELLLDCVSDRPRRAIGLESSGDKHASEEGMYPPVHKDTGHGVLLPGLLIRNRESIVLPGSGEGRTINVPARHRLSIKDVVWDPPENELRTVIF